MNLQEKCELGQKFLNSFTKENVFDGIKDIVRRYIRDEADLKLLEECDSYKMEINHGDISSFEFYFGENWKYYHVTINPLMFCIKLPSEHSYFIPMITTDTYKLIQ